MKGQTDRHEGINGIATGFEDYIFPPTLNQSAIATLLPNSTLGGMTRAVATCLLTTGLLPRAPTIPWEEKQEGLSCATFDIRNTDGATRIQPRLNHSAGGNSEGELSCC